jgi:hypothetical protein
MIERRTPTASPTATRTGIDSERTHAARSTYQLLMARGLEPVEAANLTAYLSGLRIVGTGWEIGEVLHLLFLRKLNEIGQFGRLDGATRRPLA